MKYVQTVIIVILAAALAGTAGWALSERSARLAAAGDGGRQVSEIKSSLAVLQTRHQGTARSLKNLEDSVARLEKWRNGAESRMASIEKRREEPGGLFGDLKRFMPGAGAGKMMALDGRRTQRFTVKDKAGKDVTVSLMGAAKVGPEIAKWMGLDDPRCKQLNELIKDENKRYAQQLAAKPRDVKRRGFNFGMGGGDDGWIDFVNGEKMKKLLNAEQREKLLQKFPKRCSVHMVTTGAGGIGDLRRVFIRPAPGMRGEEKEAPAPQPAPKGEHF
jgi:hypothetical protein